MLKEENMTLHNERMEQINKLSDRDKVIVLCYISGWMKNNTEFHEAFESALRDAVFFDRT
ncbi:hypothetical protein GCM10023310_70470 [Paenibacillus vulneris]